MIMKSESSEATIEPNVRNAYIPPGRVVFCQRLGREVAIICAQYQFKDKGTTLEFIICEPLDCPYYKVGDKIKHEIGTGKCYMNEKEEPCDLIKAIILKPLKEIQWLKKS